MTCFAISPHGSETKITVGANPLKEDPNAQQQFPSYKFHFNVTIPLSRSLRRSFDRSFLTVLLFLSITGRVSRFWHVMAYPILDCSLSISADYSYREGLADRYLQQRGSYTGLENTSRRKITLDLTHTDRQPKLRAIFFFCYFAFVKINEAIQFRFIPIFVTNKKQFVMKGILFYIFRVVRF